MKDPKSYPDGKLDHVEFVLDNDCKLEKGLYATLWKSRQLKKLGVQLSLTPNTKFDCLDESFYCISPEVFLK